MRSRLILLLALVATQARTGAAEEAVTVLDLLIVSGQSNAVGYDASPDQLPTDDADQHIHFWWKCGDPPPDEHDSSSLGKWLTLQPQPRGNPRSRDDKTKPDSGRQYGNYAGANGGFGPEVGLARTLYHRDGKPLAVIKVAFSGTGLKRDWDHTSPDENGLCFQALVSETRTAIAEAEKQGLKLRPRAFCWIQGESDANEQDAPVYADRLAAMLDALRREWNAPELPALIAVNTRFGGGRNAFMPAIVDQQRLLAERDPRCEYVDTSAATIANNAHYDTRGTLDVGTWFAWSLSSHEAARALRCRAKMRSDIPVKVVCFGDSVTGVYYHTGSRRAYTDMLGHVLRKHSGRNTVEMINAGISGHTTANALERVDRDVLAHEPDVVTVMFGLNDLVRVPIDQYRENLNTVIDRCETVGAEVVLATPNNVVDTSGRPTSRLVEYCNVIRDVAFQRGVPVCDTYQAMEAVRSRDDFAWRRLMSDAIHPNMDGHRFMAQQLGQTLTGSVVSLDDVRPGDPLTHSRSVLADGKPLRVLAMSPIAEHVGAAFDAARPGANIEVTSWDVSGKTLAEIQADAQQRVRALKPDLVLIAVPNSALPEDAEACASSFAWVMNWSLNFGSPTWDCVVVHPDAFETGDAHPHGDLLRQLVRAQDLQLIDRPTDVTDVRATMQQWLSDRLK